MLDGGQEMRGKVFINYRRSDSPGTAGRLYDRLVAVLPAKNLFMDVDNIEPGHDFVKLLDEQVAQCDVFLAIIGPDWLSAINREGQRRIDNPNDFVRIEISSALKRREVSVIPVLVDGAEMPGEASLPESLHSLTNLHAIEVSNTRFNIDAGRLVRAIKASFPWRIKLVRAGFAIARPAAVVASLFGFYFTAMSIHEAIRNGSIQTAYGLETLIRPSAKEWAEFTPIDLDTPMALTAC